VNGRDRHHAFFTVRFEGSPDHLSMRPRECARMCPPKGSSRTDAPAQQEILMKRILLTLALCAAGGFASAQDTLPPVVVYHVDSQRLVENCTPPAAGPECSAFHALLRQNFTEHDLGMLFGAATSYPDYRTRYGWVRERYENLLRYIDDYGLPPVAYQPVGAYPVGVIERQPTDVVYYPTSVPADQTVIVNDESAVIRTDDPDVQVLNRLPPVAAPKPNDDVIYYYDAHGVLRWRPRDE
jgi:hypothetical protein